MDIITAEAKRIQSILETGTLYGVPVDMTDQEMMLVAAYYLGKLEDSDSKIHAIDLTEYLQR